MLNMIVRRISFKLFKRRLWPWMPLPSVSFAVVVACCASFWYNRYSQRPPVGLPAGPNPAPLGPEQKGVARLPPLVGNKSGAPAPPSPCSVSVAPPAVGWLRSAVIDLAGQSNWGFEFLVIDFCVFGLGCLYAACARCSGRRGRRTCRAAYREGGPRAAS